MSQLKMFLCRLSVYKILCVITACLILSFVLQPRIKEAVSYMNLSSK